MDKKINVLIAEDDKAIVYAMKSIIEKNIDCELSIAQNGIEAWKKISEISFQLIISDWNMPFKTGYELLLDVKSNAKSNSIPFIMLTARSDKESVVNALKAGVASYLHKPFSQNDLLEKIKLALNITTTEDKQSTDTQPKLAEKKRNIVGEIVKKLKTEKFELPLLSSIAETVNTMVKDNDASIGEIVEIIKNDTILTARLLALANSPTYRDSTDYKTLDDAITRIGLPDTITHLWEFSNAGLYESENSKFGSILNKTRQHSLATAETARLIALHLRLNNSDEIYYYGLLHDIGVIFVIQIFEDIDKENPIEDDAAVNNAIHQLHSKFGAELLKRWKLPQEMQDIAEFHENISEAPNTSTNLLIVELANVFVRSLGYNETTNDCSKIDLNKSEAVKQFGIEPEFFDDLRERVISYTSEMDKMLKPTDRISLF